MSKNLAIGAKVLRKYLRSDEQDPFTLYLNSLSPSGRRSMRSQLITIVKMIGYSDAPEQFSWRDLRYVHIAKIQSALLKDGKSINTVNTSMAAVKGVMRTAFNMGLVSAEDYLRVQSVNRVKGKRLPVGRSLNVKEIKKLLGCQNSKSLICIVLGMARHWH